MKGRQQVFLQSVVGLLIGAGLAGPLALGAPPPNDDFANAIVFPTRAPNTGRQVEPFTGTTAGATVEPEEATQPNLAAVNRHGTLWWKWTCGQDGQVDFLVYSDTVAMMAAAFTGTSLTDLTTVSLPLALPWDDTLTFGVAEFRASAGVTYWMVAMANPDIDGPPGEFWGAFFFIPDPPPPPPNDMFADRISLTGTNLTVEGDNTGATAESWENVGDPWAGFPVTVWYSWTAPTHGVVYFSMEAVDPQIAFSLGTYRGEPPALSVPPVTADGGFLVAPGDTIHLQVASQYDANLGYGGGRFALHIRLAVRTPASANDDFANRLDIELPTYRFEGSVYEATSEPGEPLPAPGATQTLWWRLVPPEDGVVHFVLTSPFPLKLAVYEGTEFASLVRLPDGGGQRFRVLAGREYCVQVGSGSVPHGGLVLTARFYSLSNDCFAHSLRLEGTNVTYQGNFTFATWEPGEPSGAGTNTVWASWAAPAASVVRFCLGKAPQFQAARVFTGPALGYLQEVPIKALGSLSLYWGFVALEGVVYHFQFSGGAHDFVFRLEAQLFVPPSNDHFANAEVVQGQVMYFPAKSVVGATMEPGEPLHLGPVDQKSIWWRWTAPRPGYLRLSVGSDFLSNLVVAVYQGPSVEALGLVAKGTNNVQFLAMGGETYHIAAAVPASAMGHIDCSAQMFGLSATSALLPGNLLQEPSWEGTAIEYARYWGRSGAIGGYVNEPGGADGTTWPVLTTGARIWQDIPTVPGRLYAVQFAYLIGRGLSGCCGLGGVRVWWDDRDLGIVYVPESESGFWHWEVLTVTASNTVSRLMFENIHRNIELDAFSVVDLLMPPTIVTQPTSVSTLAGGTAAFIVGVNNALPLAYQWFFNDQPLPGATGPMLVLNSVSPAQAGTYYVVLSNALGVVTSRWATLRVEDPSSVTILVQPYGGVVPAGAYFSLSVVAVGTPPLSYQWFLNGQPLEAATNRTLVLPSVQVSNAGFYQVCVSNWASRVWSLPARLIVTNALSGGGLLHFQNFNLPADLGTNRAPVFDVDGVTPLSGSNYLAQLYAGPTLDSLRPVGEPSPFYAGFLSGFFRPQVVTLPDVAPGQTALAQVRVWEAARGATYEEARALGGKFGRSDVLQVTAGGPPLIPPPLAGLRSFSLQAGLPAFTVGVIRLLERQPNGLLVWALEGQPGFRYVVEKAEVADQIIWRPFTVLTNATGTVTFTDTIDPGAEAGFYRARILD